MDRMVRVNRNRPCPICGKPDWCLVAKDGSAAICARIQDGSKKKCGDAGYLHILANRHNRHNRHARGVKWRHHVKSSSARPRSNGFAELTSRYQQELKKEALNRLASALGVSCRSLQRLQVGWDGRAYTFPMSNDFGKILGIQRRFPNGAKVSLKGSKAGLFMPVGLDQAGPLMICEGPSDTAGALDLGFDAIGRPNCNSLVEMTVTVAGDRTDIVIIADNDNVGITGAMKLAGRLRRQCPSVKILQPPDDIKDLRQWLGRGLTRDVLCEILRAISPIGVHVAFSCREVRR